MIILWIFLGILYVACWIYFGLATFRKGHYWMFWMGFFLPFLWIIGALIAPTDRAWHDSPPARGDVILPTKMVYVAAADPSGRVRSDHLCHPRRTL